MINSPEKVCAAEPRVFVTNNSHDDAQNTAGCDGAHPSSQMNNGFDIIGGRRAVGAGHHEHGCFVASRRRMLSILTLSLGAVIAALIGIPSAALILEPSMRRRTRVWRRLETVDTYPLGQTVAVRYENAATLPWDGVVAFAAAWVRREKDNEFVAFAVNCAHLGCPVRWLPEANLFMCPCHGGVYYSNGEVAAGPPPRPLTRLPVRVREGFLEIEAGPIPMGQERPEMTAPGKQERTT